MPLVFLPWKETPSVVANAIAKDGTKLRFFVGKVGQGRWRYSAQWHRTRDEVWEQFRNGYAETRRAAEAHCEALWASRERSCEVEAEAKR